MARAKIDIAVDGQWVKRYTTAPAKIRANFHVRRDDSSFPKASVIRA